MPRRLTNLNQDQNSISNIMNGFTMQELTATATATSSPGARNRLMYSMALAEFRPYLQWNMNLTLTRGIAFFTSSSDANLRIYVPLPSPEWMDTMLTLAGDIDAHIHIKYHGTVTVFVPVRAPPRPVLRRSTAGTWNPGLDPVHHAPVFVPFAQQHD